MALDTRGIAYKVSADTVASEASLARMEKGFGSVAGQADRSRTALLNFGKQGELTARQIQALSYQTTDIVTGLLSGQRPLMVLLQQGGQLRDQFGGVGNVLRAFAQVLSPVRLALGGVAGAAIAVGLGMAQGYQESVEFRKQMALTGNAAGLTAGQVDTLAASLAEFSGNTIGNAREAVLALAKSGQFTGSALEAAGRAALVMQRLTGESIDDIVKRFAGARDGVARWAAEANRSYNYLTSGQYQYIRALEAQGRVQDALRANFDALAQVMEQRQAPALGTLEKLWQGVKNAASGAWDAVKAFGRDDTVEQQLEKIRKKIAGAGKSDNAFAKLALGELRDQEAYLQEQQRMQRAAANRASEEAQGNQKAIEEASKAHQDALGAIARAGIEMRLQQQQAGFAASLAATEAAYKRFEISPQAFRDRTAAALRGPLDAEKASLQAQLALERQRVVEKPTDVYARDAAILQLETKIAQVEAKRAELNRDIAEFKKAAAAPREPIETAQAAFRQAEIAAQNAVEQASRQGSLEAQRAIDELLSLIHI